MVKRHFSISAICVIGCIFTLFLFGCTSLHQGGQEGGAYKRFSSAEYPWYQINFDYPSTWEIGGRGAPFLFMQDLTKPTLALGEEEFFGEEVIQLETTRGDAASFVQEITHYIQLHSNNPDLASFIDREIEIDGYPARWLTFEFQNSYNTPVPFIKEMIFLFVENQQRYYTFMLQIPAENRGGRYEQTFDLMIDTLKVVDDQ